jgi:hypothetical protein
MDNPKNSSFPRKRESSPSKELPRDAGDKAKRYVRENRWIPAFAGMAVFEFLEAP